MATTPRQFRLGDSTLADLDVIAAHLADRNGGRANRADAIRAAAREMARKLDRKNLEKLPQKRSGSIDTVATESIVDSVRCE